MRPSIQIVIFLVLLNASAGLITASGLGAALDVNPEIGGDEAVGDAQQEAEQVEPSQGRLDTLFSLFTSTAGTMASIFKLIFYGPVMLQNLGVPAFITTFVFGAAGIVVAADVIHYLAGRG